MTDRELNGLFEDLRRHFDVTAERFDSRLGLVAESMLMLDQRMVGVGSRLESLEVKVDSLEVKVDSLEVKVDSLEVKVESLDSKIGSTAAETQGMIRDLDRRVAALEERP